MAKNWEYAAGKIWPILVRAAQNDTTLTYGDLAPLIETNPLSVRNALGPILFYCLESRLPPLTVVVVGKISGVPGSGFTAWDADNLEEAYEQVYTFNWEAVENPFLGYKKKDTTDTLAQEIVKNPEKSEDIYSRVKVRGAAQRIFRRVLLQAYDFQCAICQFSFEEALEAAHIVPWSKSEHAHRMSPKNGILLCSNHHKMFDCGYINVTSKFTIIYEDNDSDRECYSESDLHGSILLNGRQILLPLEEKLWPDPELLRLRILE